MKIAKEYIQDLKALEGSYYKASKKLDITIQSLMKLSRGETTAKDETCIKIANLLNIDAKEVLLSAAIARNYKNKDLMKIWENISKKAGVAASFLIGLSLEWPILEGFFIFMNNSVKCILCKIRILSCCNESVPE